MLNIVPITATRKAIFQEKKSALSSQGTAFASAISHLDNITASSIREILSLLDMQDYAQIIVTDSHSNIIYNSNSSLDNRYENDVETSLKGKSVFHSKFKNSTFDSSYTTLITSDDNVIGTVFVRELDSERGKILMSTERRVLVVSIFLVALTILGIVLFSSSIFTRFDELSTSMRTVANGDYKHRLEVKGEDELSSLGNEFNSLTEKLETTESQRRRFVSDASHELKTPLASIRLLSDSILQNKNIDKETLREFVSDIGNEAERLQHTTENLLNLSRLDDDVKVAEEPVDVRQVTLDTLALIKPIASTNKIKIKSKLDDGCVIMATRDNVTHIVFNLIENGIKYNVPNGTVWVSCCEDGDNVIIEVKDSGIGIPAEERLNVFTRFYRIDKARSRESGGSGLGLSIVHDTVKLHRGTITIGANKPCGSIFTVTFPKADDSQTGI